MGWACGVRRWPRAAARGGTTVPGGAAWERAGEGGVELEELTLDPFLLSVGVEDGRKGDVDGGGGALGSL